MNNIKENKSFNNNLTKEDLNKEELQSYNKLMDGISNAPKEEKDEVAHLMEMFVETEEEVHTKCVRCKKEFNDEKDYLDGEVKRIYCNDCLNKMWSAQALD